MSEATGGPTGGATRFVGLELTNASESEEFFQVLAVAPPGWTVAPERVEVSVYGGQSGLVTLAVERVSADAAGGELLVRVAVEDRGWVGEVTVGVSG